MISPWIAEQLARRDNSLGGWWPCRGNRLDHSGRGAHGRGITTSGSLTTAGFATHLGRTGFRTSGGAILMQCLVGDQLSLHDILAAGSRGLTASCWFSALSSTTGAVLSQAVAVAGVAGRYRGWQVRIASGNLTFRITDDSGVSETVVSSEVPSLGRWVHVAATISWKGDSYLITLYLDGRPAASGSFSTAPTNTNSPVVVGGVAGSDGAGGTSYTSPDALATDVRMYSRPLSPAELATLYRQELTPVRKDVSYAGLTKSLYLVLKGPSLEAPPVLLTVQGASGTAGSFTMVMVGWNSRQGLSEDLFLVVKSDPGGIVPLICNGPTRVLTYPSWTVWEDWMTIWSESGTPWGSGDPPFYLTVLGVGGVDGSVNLSMPSTTGNETGDVTMYTSGF